VQLSCSLRRVHLPSVSGARQLEMGVEVEAVELLWHKGPQSMFALVAWHLAWCWSTPLMRSSCLLFLVVRALSRTQTAVTQVLKTLSLQALLCLTFPFSSSSRWASRWLQRAVLSRTDGVLWSRQLRERSCWDQFQNDFQEEARVEVRIWLQIWSSQSLWS